MSRAATEQLKPHAGDNGHSRKLIDLGAAIKRPFWRRLFALVRPLLEKTLAVDFINRSEQRLRQIGSEKTVFQNSLDIIGLKYRVNEEALAQVPKTGPVVVVANHPFGGADAMILAHLIKRIRPDAKVLSNFLLERVPFVDPHLIKVNPFSRNISQLSNTSGLREALRFLKGGGLLATFPATKVSFFQLSRMRVTDKAWSPHIAALIRRSKATVLPVHFHGRNGFIFNLIGMIHGQLRTLLLPRELKRRCARPQPQVKVTVGRPIPFSRLAEFEDDEKLSRFLRVTTYILENRPPSPDEKPPRRAAASPSPSRQEVPVAAPLDPAEVEAEIAGLPEECLLVSKNELAVYLAEYDAIPRVMHEIGRCREISFRAVGGGTHKPLDISDQDSYYHHLFLWDRKTREVAGAYRVGLTDLIVEKYGPGHLITAQLFKFKPEFVEKLACGLELGRSVILPKYQKRATSLSLMWAGVLQFIVRNPKYHVIFGSVGISQGDEYSPASRTLIINFLRDRMSHPSFSFMVEPRSRFRASRVLGIDDPGEVSELVTDVEDVSLLVSSIEADGKELPVLIKQYLRMNAKLISFGVWEEHSNAVVSLMVSDLLEVRNKFLQRYMGTDGYRQFLAYHNLSDSSPASTSQNNSVHSRAVF